MKINLKEVRRFQKIAGLLKEYNLKENTDLDKLKSIFKKSSPEYPENKMSKDITDVFEKDGKYTVVLSGETLGYNDKNIYEISWDPNTGEVTDEVYDRSGDYIGSGSTWSEPVTSVEEFIDVITQNAEGSWG